MACAVGAAFSGNLGADFPELSVLWALGTDACLARAARQIWRRLSNRRAKLYNLLLDAAFVFLCRAAQTHC